MFFSHIELLLESLSATRMRVHEQLQFTAMPVPPATIRFAHQENSVSINQRTHIGRSGLQTKTESGQAKGLHAFIRV